MVGLYPYAPGGRVVVLVVVAYVDHVTGHYADGVEYLPVEALVFLHGVVVAGRREDVGEVVADFLDLDRQHFAYGVGGDH